MALSVDINEERVSKLEGSSEGYIQTKALRDKTTEVFF